jgi:hypothetical protein
MPTDTGSAKASVTQLRPAGTNAPIINNEAYFISALLETGEYAPGKYGIKDKDFVAHTLVHRFCTDYQHRAGQAPAVTLVQSKFPTFTYAPDISITWAAGEVNRDTQNRELRSSLGDAVRSIDVDEPIDIVKSLQNSLGTIRSLTKPGINVVEYRADENEAEGCPVPGDELQRVTNGHQPGEVWLIAARMGVGKTWRLVEHAVTAAEYGWNVNFFSLEMKTSRMADRLYRYMLRNSYKGNWADIDMRTKYDLLDQWQEESGHINVITTKELPSVNVNDLEDWAEPDTLMVIDHIQLLRANHLHKSASPSDRIMAVSQELHNVAQRNDIPLLSAVQFNRTAAGVNREGNAKEPRIEDLFGSDSLGMDADLILAEQALVNQRLMIKHSMMKNRNGEICKPFYTWSDPNKLVFGEVTEKQAEAFKARH